MEMVRDLPEADRQLPLGTIAERWGESAGRIMDACDANRVLNGERTYIPL